MAQANPHPAVSADGCWHNLRLAPELYVSEVADIPEGTLACIVVQQGRMVWVGPQDAMPAEYQALPRHDGAGRLTTPGLIDCHTHLVYGGERANEFAMRLAGASYEEVPGPAAASSPASGPRAKRRRTSWWRWRCRVLNSCWPRA